MDVKISLYAKKEKKTTVKQSQTTSFLWEGENVFSTPSMISEMEETCRLLLKEQFLNDNDEFDSVGTLVDIKHLAATPVGAEITLNAEIISADDSRILFKVTAKERLELIGEGKHERFNKKVEKLKE